MARVGPVGELPQTKEIRPKILYFGTPVVLLSTLNEDGTTNLAPMSSAWALGWRLVLGLGTSGKSYENLERHPEVVMNLPGPLLWRSVESLASLTGKHPVPEEKMAMGFRHAKDKFEAAGLTALPSVRVQPRRAAECPLQIEGEVLEIHRRDRDPDVAIVEVQAVRVHAHAAVVRDGDHVDPRAWSPLIYNFRHYHGLAPELGKTFRAET